MPPLILVVDDEPAIRDILVDILMDEDYAVRTAANGREALAVHGVAAADVILSDVMMPVLDGNGLLRELRSRGDATPVILMSAKPASAGGNAGTPQIGKPFDVDAMLALISTAVAHG